MSNYAKEYYQVPADIGRLITYRDRTGIIAADGGNYIGVNFDDLKPGVISNIHPTDENLTYLEDFGKIRKMTPSQARYQRYLRVSECFDHFMDFCYWDAEQSKAGSL
ncbi:MAG: hypothetical protein ACRBHB_17195 [Arenicella sp.]